MEVYLNSDFFKALRPRQPVPQVGPTQLGKDSEAIGVPVTSGYGIKEEFNAHAPQTEEVHKKLFGDVPLKEVHDAFSQQGNNGYYTKVHRIHLSRGMHSSVKPDRVGGFKAHIHGDTYHPQHGKVGSGFTRWIAFNDKGEKEAHHVSFYINKDHQRNGVSKAMFRGVIPLYQKIGVKRVKIDTLDKQGRHTWARAGFHWGDAGTRRVKTTLPTFLKHRYGLSEEASRAVAHRYADKPWEVAALHVPLTKNHHYVGRTGEEGHYQYHYADGFGNKTLGTNAPEGWAEHDPSKGTPHLHAGHAYLTDDHFGSHVWQDGGTMELQEGHPTFEHAKRYFGLKG